MLRPEWGDVNLQRVVLGSDPGRLLHSLDRPLLGFPSKTSLLRWYRVGDDPQAKLPLLATYMGHISSSPPIITCPSSSPSGRRPSFASRRATAPSSALGRSSREVGHAMTRPAAEHPDPPTLHVTLNRLILFGESGLRRASMRPGARHRERNHQGLGNEGRSGLPTDPGRQETVLRRDRGGDYVHVWSASPVIWAEARPARHPAGPGNDLSGRAVSRRCYGIPISRFHWRFKRGGTEAPGRRVAARSMV